jgi:hypothetical protein
MELNKEEVMCRTVSIITKMLSLCEPTTYKEFNKILKANNRDELRAYEKEHPEVGLAQYGLTDEGVSTLSILATITELLIGERLAFKLGDNETLVGVEWYKKHKENINGNS